MSMKQRLFSQFSIETFVFDHKRKAILDVKTTCLFVSEQKYKERLRLHPSKVGMPRGQRDKSLSMTK